MKYIFVCADFSFLTLQYRDFSEADKYELITTKGRVRLVMKALNAAKLYKFKVLDFCMYSYFDKCFSGIKHIDDDVCFIIYSRTYEDFRSMLTRYLRKKYEGCKIVVYYGDIVSRHLCKPAEVKKDVDLVCSFDSAEAKKYSMEWLLEPFSGSVVDIDDLSAKNNRIKWDVTFVGHAKDRFDRIIEIYEIMVANGLRCDFHITGVEKDKRVHTDMIGYESLNFTELLRHVVQSKCILEIMQGNGVSPTTRYTEAMLFGRNLLTDCKAFQNEHDRSPNIIYYDNPNELTPDLLSEAIEIHSFDKNTYVDRFSIDTFVNSIEKMLN